MRLLIGPTKYGPMAYLHNDIAFVQALHGRGEIYEQALVEEILAPYICRANLILDIGAHCGSHSLIYSALNPSAQIVAYEPQEALRNCLLFNINGQGRRNIRVEGVAIGNRTCTAAMHATIPDGPNCNRPTNDDEYFNFGGRQLGIGGEPVAIHRLDDLWPMAGVTEPPVDFMKIDVEGFENFVVDGAAALIDRCRPVIFFEHNEKQVTAAMEGYYNAGAADICDFLRKRGYTVNYIDNGNYLALP